MTERLVPVTVRAATAATVEQAFAVGPPIDLTRIFTGFGPLPAVVGVRDQTGPWDRVGVSRKPQLSDGTAAFEQITVYAPPTAFGYEVSRFTNALRLLVTGARGDWTFAPTADGGSTITWTYSFRPRRFRRAAVRLLLAPLWRRYMRQGLAAVVREVHRAYPPRPSGLPR